jgi:hypothetical protein
MRKLLYRKWVTDAVYLLHISTEHIYYLLRDNIASFRKISLMIVYLSTTFQFVAERNKNLGT